MKRMCRNTRTFDEASTVINRLIATATLNIQDAIHTARNNHRHLTHSRLLTAVHQLRVASLHVHETEELPEGLPVEP